MTLLSNRAVSRNKNRDSELLLGPNLRLKIIPVLGAIFYRYNMNDVIYTFLLAGNKFILEIHLR